MGISYAIEDNLLLLTAEGEYGLQDLQEVLGAAIASPGFEAPMCVCADATGSKANPSASEIAETAYYLGSIREHFMPTWILVVRGSLRYGLARMLSVFTSQHGIDLRVYRDIDEGRSLARELTAEPSGV